MYRSLCVLVFIAILIFKMTLGQPIEDKRIEKCREEAKIDENRIISEYYPSLVTEPDTMCYVACMLRESKTVNAEGTLNLEDPNLNIEDFKNCAYKTGKDFCDRAAKTIMCLYNWPNYTR